MAIKFLSGVNIDSNTLFVDDANNRVGIGTGSPTAKLQLYGSGLVEANVTSTNDQSLLYLQGTFGQVANNAGDFYITNSAPSSSLILRTADTERMRITSAGNVGIGTTSPDVKFQVQGGVVKATTSNYASPSTGGAISMFQDSNDYGTIWAVKNYNGDWANVAISPLGGNVGIGTTSPNSKLNVVGDAATNGLTVKSAGNSSTFPLRVTWSSGSDGDMLNVDDDGRTRLNNAPIPTVGGFTNTTLVVKQKANGLYGGGLHIEQASTDNVAYFGFTGSVFNIGTSYRTSGSFQPIAFVTNGSERLRIANDGNVGIGTTAPTWKLQTESSSSTVAMFRSSDSNTIVGIDNSAVDGDPQLKFYINDIGTFTLGVDDSDSDKFKIGTSDLTTNTRLTIDGSGNVGIGTTSPFSRFTVARNGINEGTISYEDESNNAHLTISGSDAFVRLQFGTYNNGSYSSWIQSSYDNSPGGSGASGAQGLAINPQGGNVGIGTPGPSEKLHVSGNIRVTGAYYDSANSAGSSGQVLSSTGSGTDWVSLSEITGVDGTGTANYIAKWSDTDTITNSQVFDNGTNVGINNASPKTKLDVNGAIGFGSKSMSMTDTFAAALTINMFDHHGCYVKLTAFGDWANHSTIAYLGEFFIQASEGSYNEPGIIIRQVDNTGGGDDIQAQIVDPAGTGTRDFVIQLKATSASNTPFTAYLQYEVRGLYNSVS